eukprot:5330479-Amphidinium_carterae.1
MGFETLSARWTQKLTPQPQIMFLLMSCTSDAPSIEHHLKVNSIGWGFAGIVDCVLISAGAPVD